MFSRKEGIAQFFESIILIVTKQLIEMKDLLINGEKVIIIYLIQRNDSKYFKLAKGIDEKYYDVFYKLNN